MQFKTILQSIYSALIGLAGVALTAVHQAASEAATISDSMDLDKLIVFVVMFVVARAAGWLVSKIPSTEG